LRKLCWSFTSKKRDLVGFGSSVSSRCLKRIHDGGGGPAPKRWHRLRAHTPHVLPGRRRGRDLHSRKGRARRRRYTTCTGVTQKCRSFHGCGTSGGGVAEAGSKLASARRRRRRPAGWLEGEMPCLDGCRIAARSCMHAAPEMKLDCQLGRDCKKGEKKLGQGTHARKEYVLSSLHFCSSSNTPRNRSFWKMFILRAVCTGYMGRIGGREYNPLS
jgi:hypothetical protein